MKFLYRRSLFHLENLCQSVQVTVASRRSRELQKVDGSLCVSRNASLHTPRTAMFVRKEQINVGSDPAGRGGCRLRAVDRLRVRL
jgi:hypothetical protein